MSSATEVFDPYREWLGIEPHELPADHYRLLGLPRFETDTEKIGAAADGRMRLIRSNQMGPRGAFTYTLLNEITAAKLCLLSPVAKAQYDNFLQERMKVHGPAAAPARFFPTAVPLNVHAAGLFAVSGGWCANAAAAAGRAARRADGRSNCAAEAGPQI